MLIKYFFTNSISKKILYVFLVATLIPIFSLTYVSNTYIASIIEKETHSNLIKYAKSYGLVTLEKIQSFEYEINKISEDVDSNLPRHIASNLESIELIPVGDISSSGFGNSQNPILDHYYGDNNALLFKIDKLHYSSAAGRR